MIREADIDNDGKISFDEFKSVMKAWETDSSTDTFVHVHSLYLPWKLIQTSAINFAKVWLINTRLSLMQILLALLWIGWKDFADTYKIQRSRLNFSPRLEPRVSCHL